MGGLRFWWGRRKAIKRESEEAMTRCGAIGPLAVIHRFVVLWIAGFD